MLNMLLQSETKEILFPDSGHTLTLPGQIFSINLLKHTHTNDVYSLGSWRLILVGRVTNWGNERLGSRAGEAENPKSPQSL